jgi:hypothetical protein
MRPQACIEACISYAQDFSEKQAAKESAMITRNGVIIPESERVNLTPLITIGLTDKWEIGVMWPNDQLRHDLINRLSIADMQKLKDTITIALAQSLNKRLPTVFNVT